MLPGYLQDSLHQRFFTSVHQNPPEEFLIKTNIGLPSPEFWLNRHGVNSHRSFFTISSKDSNMQKCRDPTVTQKAELGLKSRAKDGRQNQQGYLKIIAWLHLGSRFYIYIIVYICYPPKFLLFISHLVCGILLEQLEQIKTGGGGECRESIHKYRQPG